MNAKLTKLWEELNFWIARQDELSDLFFADRHYHMKISAKCDDEIRSVLKIRIN